MQANASVDQDIPAAYNGFVYVIQGASASARIERPDARPRSPASIAPKLGTHQRAARGCGRGRRAPGGVCGPTAGRPDRVVRPLHWRLEGGHREAFCRIPRRAIRTHERSRTTRATRRLNSAGSGVSSEIPTSNREKTGWRYASTRDGAPELVCREDNCFPSELQPEDPGFRRNVTRPFARRFAVTRPPWCKPGQQRRVLTGTD